jgi:hypothetical protein
MKAVGVVGFNPLHHFVVPLPLWGRRGGQQA